ncbi:MAG: hypothetical protein NUW06_00785 [Candidatus Acetothermia bacterium]|jgi:hypothetical protein|nr:hypothetical protein [Candidatus Acetothermia bacterium]MDH7505704.1 hypothetical protein [Candidatus Acetothermia bacterium]
MEKTTILQYLSELERKLAELRRAVERMPEEPGAPEAVRFVDKRALASLIARSFRKMGIQPQPVGAERLQELIAACGVEPEANAFSRAIIALREG